MLQHLSVNLWEYGTPSANNTPPSGDENTGPNGQLASDFHFGLGLSPPTDSKLLQRRKSLQSQSLQLTRFKNPETVLKIQVCICCACTSDNCIKIIISFLSNFFRNKINYYNCRIYRILLKITFDYCFENV